MTETWEYEAHLPKGSGDVEWRVTAGDDLIAIVDPEMRFGDPEAHARLIAAAPKLLAALKVAQQHAPCQLYADVIAEADGGQVHVHVGVGYCPICKHYGQDCTGAA